jgi:hypothetical protein
VKSTRANRSRRTAKRFYPKSTGSKQTTRPSACGRSRRLLINRVGVRPATAAANCIVLVSGRWKIQGRQSSERESGRHSGQPPALAARGTQREASGWGVASQADAGEAKGSRREAPRDESDGKAEGAAATTAAAAEAARHDGAGGAARRGRGGDRHQGRREGGRRGSTSTPPPVSGGHRLGPTPSSRQS